ncbi:sporulation protein YqfD [Alteribacter keqinensis]|uniref:Sporulation protein YqfD n=1 Tax=Alteribacter keqinensis TaxID=2483800 RepID=A0A3M7TTA9_9BACI|nr:sporulation protein YqfD [Alteribacter keqinensis]RNA68866.1 sporulation protein YqfD [Alteribacter keqinensis]
MKNMWINTFSGYVRVKVEGTYPELFINRCNDNKIMIWDIRQAGEKTYVCSVLLDDVKRLRKVSRESGCKIRFLERKGAPFFIRKMVIRNGFVTGTAIFVALLFLLANMVWNIEIDGASPAMEHDIRQKVDELGIQRGKLQFRLPPPEVIQEEISDEIPDATWIGVTIRGTTYHFQVVEKELAEKEPAEAPGHLVASRKAVIHHMFVEQGSAVVEANQVVKKGDLLVTGLIGREGKEQRVAAKGEVFGEVWYKAHVTVPLEQTFHAVTGNYDTHHYINFGRFQMPVWGFGDSEFEAITEEEFTRSFSPFGYTLPFQYKRVTNRETETVNQVLAYEEALETAKDKSRIEVMERFSEKAEIMGEKVLHEEEQNGKVKVTIHYRIIDNISRKQPIIQGD